MSGIAAGLLALLASACIAIPPTRSSYGPAFMGSGAGYRASVGAQSLAADRADVHELDLGAGWVSEGGRGRGAVHGTYLALARRLPWSAGRLWLGGRAELFWSDLPGTPRRGVVVRSVYRRRLGRVSGGSTGGGDAVFAHGTFALDVHLDVGVRTLHEGRGEVFVAAGGSFDLPFLFAASRPGPIF